MSAEAGGYWSLLLKQLRQRQGLSQTALAQVLGVDQTSVSRWERGVDVPRLTLRTRLRELMRNQRQPLQDAAIMARVRYAAWPTSLVRRGAIFLEVSKSIAAEVGYEGGDLRGSSIYGRFGDLADDVTAHWEKTGIFDGDVAATISVNAIKDAQGETTFVRTLDTPHITSDGDIWCYCEVKRIPEADYRRLVSEYRGATLIIPFA